MFSILLCFVLTSRNVPYRPFPGGYIAFLCAFACEISVKIFNSAEFSRRIIFLYELFLTNRKNKLSTVLRHRLVSLLFVMQRPLGCEIHPPLPSLRRSGLNDFSEGQMGRGGRNLSWPQILVLKQTRGLHSFLFRACSWGWSSCCGFFLGGKEYLADPESRAAVVWVSLEWTGISSGFLPWVWRTWDGFMHFRLGTFLPFRDLLKPLTPLIIHGLIPPHFLPCKHWISG